MKEKLHEYWIVSLAAIVVLASCSKGSRDAASGNESKQAETKATGQERPAGKPGKIAKGQLYRAIDDKQVLKIVSSDELELREKAANLLCKFSVQDGKLRVVADVLGTKQVGYYTLVEDGLRDDDDGTLLYRPDRYEAVMRDVLAKRKQKALNQQLLDATYKADLANAISALESGAQVAITNADQQTPLHLAAERGMTNLVELLLSKGADPRARENDRFDNVRKGMTPLHLAAWLPQSVVGNTPSGYPRVAQDRVVAVLLKAGADVNGRDEAGRTPLLLALQAANDAAVRLLVDAGADRASALAYAKEQMRGGWADRRAALRTPDEARSFEEATNASRVIQTIRGFDFERNRPEQYQLTLTDVGVNLKLDGSSHEYQYPFSDFGLRFGKDPESKEFEPEGRYPKIYRVDFNVGGQWYVNLKTAEERDKFFKALRDAHGAWKQKYGSIP